MPNLAIIKHSDHAEHDADGGRDGDEPGRRRIFVEAALVKLSTRSIAG